MSNKKSENSFILKFIFIMFNLLIDNCLVLLLNGTRIGRMQRIFADFFLFIFELIFERNFNTIK